MTTAIFPTISNPPTFGTILSLKYIEDMYEKIFVIVKDVSLILSVDRVVSMLEKVLCKDTLKYSIIISSTDFDNVTVLPPELPKHDTILTVSPRIYANFINKGYGNVVLIPKPVGYDETLHRLAFQRSLTMERVSNSIRTISTPDEYVEDLKKEKMNKKENGA